MDIVDIDSLNEAQREAVLCTEGPLLVLAGAGSGQDARAHHTACICWEIWACSRGILPSRSPTRLRPRCASVWASFVGPCGARHVGLNLHERAHAAHRLREAGLDKGFTHLDDDDSKRLVRDIMAEFDIDPKRPINAIRNRISTAKNETDRPRCCSSRRHDPSRRLPPVCTSACRNA